MKNISIIHNGKPLICIDYKDGFLWLLNEKPLKECLCIANAETYNNEIVTFRPVDSAPPPIVTNANICKPIFAQYGCDLQDIPYIEFGSLIERISHPKYLDCEHLMESDSERYMVGFDRGFFFGTNLDHFETQSFGDVYMTYTYSGKNCLDLKLIEKI